MSEAAPNRSLEPVTQYLTEHSHPHLTINMVKQQATVVDDPERPGAVVFDVERTRGALGARYRQDRPLAAVETYWVRYSYDQEQKFLRQIGTNVADDHEPNVTINSVPQLLRDYWMSVLGLVNRAWPDGL